jgi:phosphopantetheinyl transferase
VQLLTDLLPSELSGVMMLGWCKVGNNYSKEVLTAEEEAACDTFKDERREDEYIATQRLVQYIIQDMDMNPDRFILKKDALGKPFGLYDEELYHVSIAHTNDRVLCAASSTIPVGVDMEPESRKVVPELRNRILNETERPLFEREETLRLWTIKEALVKWQGSGLRTNLNEWTIQSVRNSLLTAIFDNDKRANICSFNHQGYWLAVAWDG